MNLLVSLIDSNVSFIIFYFIFGALLNLSKLFSMCLLELIKTNYFHEESRTIFNEESSFDFKNTELYLI